MDENLISEFLAQKNFAVAGSFRDESKYAYQILKNLIQKGYTVYPINPRIKKVDELECYPTVLDLPQIVDVINIVTPPKITENIVKQCLEKGITRVWIQPGAESETAIAFCLENNIKVIYNACVMLGK